MKLIKYSLGMLVTMLVFLTSCTDFVEPRIPYSSFDTGAYLRTVARTSVSFNFFDLPNSKFDITVEGVDAENGATIESVEVRVRRRRLIPGVGLQYVPVGTGTNVVDVEVKKIPASAFAVTGDSKFLRTGISVTAAEAITALGLTPAQVNGGDVFEFRLRLTDKFGRVFNDVNASADIKGGLFYDSPFLYNVTVVCPLTNGYGLGQYRLTQPVGGADPFFGNPTRFVEEVVTLSAGNTGTQRRFTVKYLGGFTTRTFTIEFSCGKVIKPLESAGAGCGGPGITWISDPGNLANYNPASDASITVKFIDDSQSSCGITAPVEFVLTKL
ncbi:hypothetical protein MMU07_02945 [Aquiflexum sp. LQ15W]|uniref:hypothetical protein n=1 Tax=Cognataquiflexum nitidum TaxID=2922272 RepID=UPI001F136EF2|nr:hypothetical protein [Cognataquiflexum nitidum]MCH6198521.1 hypothetical protein [Cognataquiflexum nitidum]